MVDDLGGYSCELLAVISANSVVSNSVVTPGFIFAPTAAKGGDCPPRGVQEMLTTLELLHAQPVMRSAFQAARAVGGALSGNQMMAVASRQTTPRASHAHDWQWVAVSVVGRLRFVSAA